MQASEDVQMSNSTAMGSEEVDPSLLHTSPAIVEQQRQLHIDDDFDWETYIAAYRGRTKIERLLFLAQQAPALRIPCSTAALQAITTSSNDVKLYNLAYLIRNTEPPPSSKPLPAQQSMPKDSAWEEAKEKSNRSELEKLDLELRNYQNNMIKESIRMGYRDLGDHLRSTGSLGEASRFYNNTRDYCSTNEHLVEMCLNMIEVSLDMREYLAVGGYVSKAEGLLESYDPHAAAASSSSSAASKAVGGIGAAASKGGSTSGADAIGALFRAGGSAGASASLSGATSQFRSASSLAVSQRDVETQGKRHVRDIQAKLHVAQGIAHLGLSRYKASAKALLEVAPDAGDAFATMASRSDVATIMVLCSLAMFDRSELKSFVIDRTGISGTLEYDLQAQQLLEAFYACDYRRALALLDKMSVRCRLNIDIAPHYDALCRHIIQRALRQFVQPFDTLRIARLATSLGWQGPEGESRVVEELLPLIQRGDINARLDMQNNILIANKIEARQALFKSALEAGQRQTMTAKRLMLRVSLLQNGLIAKTSLNRENA